MTEVEIIKEIKGFEGRYTISNLGIVRSLLTNKIMKLSITKFGYARVNLRYANSRKFKSFLVHRLVAMNFLPNPNNYKEINHKDCNRLNNKLDNLEWCDRFYNIKYSFTNGYASNKGIRNPRAKLTEQEVKEIKRLLKTKKFYYTDIVEMFNISDSAIQFID